jgi:flavin prenyltransferase
MRIIVGVSGASGIALATDFLKTLRTFKDVEIHLVMSDGAGRTLELELEQSREEFTSLAHHVHPIGDIGATIASGSFDVAGMVVVPCSMKTLAGIVHGYSDNLLLRAADVCLKERRRLVLVTREMPLSSLHLENMLAATRHGAIVMPPMMTFYNAPKSIEDMCHHVTGKILMHFGMRPTSFRGWEGTD